MTSQYDPSNTFNTPPLPTSLQHTHLDLVALVARHRLHSGLLVKLQGGSALEQQHLLEVLLVRQQVVQLKGFSVSNTTKIASSARFISVGFRKVYTQ